MSAKRGEAAAFIKAALLYTGNVCLLWPFAVLNSGYPTSKNGTVHVIVCEAKNGPRPPGADAAHSCGNKLCVARRHLSWKSRSGNERDKILHGRSNRGERHGNSKLAQADVLAIRISPWPNSVDAAFYNVSPGYISEIKNLKVWAWL